MASQAETLHKGSIYITSTVRRRGRRLAAAKHRSACIPGHRRITATYGLSCRVRQQAWLLEDCLLQTICIRDRSGIHSGNPINIIRPIGWVLFVECFEKKLRTLLHPKCIYFHEGGSIFDFLKTFFTKCKQRIFCPLYRCGKSKNKNSWVNRLLS
jgi:hypothetical protein